ncbi:MAG: hypothetical protein AAGF47_08500 [Planctomycetota bacterium]
MAVQEHRAVLEAVKASAESAGCFGPVSLHDALLICNADGSAEPAVYTLSIGDDGLWVALLMKDRWQSESIESDLMHSGDKLEELLDEELAELGYDPPPGVSTSYQHFRSEDLEFVFRSRVPVPEGASSDEASRVATALLLAYEACFRQLGDMDSDGDDD